MPLAFQSLNRGTVAFGFFNIDTDLLLLQQYFLFADDFCGHVIQMAEYKRQEPYDAPWEVHSIEDPRKIGDLVAAIRGIHHAGFIGEVYKQFPFPKKEADFKQKPEGFLNRNWMISLLQKWAARETVSVRVDEEHGTVSISEYLFTRKVFHQLIQYVWGGGYPRWKDEIRPDYVLRMKSSLEKAGGWLTRGLVFP
jgi:hypothetical protein